MAWFFLTWNYHLAFEPSFSLIFIQHVHSNLNQVAVAKPEASRCIYPNLILWLQFRLMLWHLYHNTADGRCKMTERNSRYMIIWWRKPMNDHTTDYSYSTHTCRLCKGILHLLMQKWCGIGNDENHINVCLHGGECNLAKGCMFGKKNKQFSY